jgi:hypothetical protein
VLKEKERRKGEKGQNLTLKYLVGGHVGWEQSVERQRNLAEAYHIRRLIILYC